MGDVADPLRSTANTFTDLQRERGKKGGGRWGMRPTPPQDCQHLHRPGVQGRQEVRVGVGGVPAASNL